MHVLVLSLSITALVLSFALFVSTTNKTLAGPQPNPGHETNPSECDTQGKQVINVNEKVVKTVDSGLSGYWAFDDINRHIQVWQNSTNEFCALVQNEGKFDAQVGATSPGDKAQELTGNEDGSFRGGYRAKITGILKASPNWPTKGNVGTTTYNCDLSASCPGYVNWIDQYFGPGYVFSYEWWGWTYRYKNNTWVNSSDGNSGDLI